MMRAALSMRVTEAVGYKETRDCLSNEWPTILVEMGITPHPVPNTGEAAISILEAISPDVLILTGGNDIGEMPQRDNTEFALLSHALDKGLPVLGVCRGIQIINAHFGGSLTTIKGHVDTTHDVDIADLWQTIYTSRVQVNSFHNNGITRDGLGDGLVCAATDADGCVEGLYHSNSPLAAVMWHMERKGGLDGDRALLMALIKRTVPWL